MAVSIWTHPRKEGEALPEWFARIALERAIEAQPDKAEELRGYTWVPDSRELAEHMAELQCRLERIESAEELRRLSPRPNLIGRAKRALLRVAILALDEP